MTMRTHVGSKISSGYIEIKYVAFVLAICAALLGLYYLNYVAGASAGEQPFFYGVVSLGLVPIAVSLPTLSVLVLRRQVKVLKKRYHVLLTQSERDMLTGVRTREKFLVEATARLRERAPKRHAALLLVDIDHFKQVNDAHGHPVGDEVLSFFAKQLRLHFHDALIGRLGGDEFGVLIDHADPITTGFLLRTCDEFITALKQGVGVASSRLPVSASIGIALAPEHGNTLGALVANADAALYSAKKQGRASAMVFDEDMMSDVRNEKALVRELRAAMLLGHLRVAYQPIVDAQGRLVAYEALLRWRHMLRGVIPPDVFIPVAERASLIAEIGYYVIRQVCADTSRLEPVPVNINLSASQIAAPDLLGRILEILEQTGTTPDQIVIEITESASLAANDVVAGHLRAIQAKGFRIALDDFGMGYSEFNQLRALPYDVIKIDKSYIRALGSDTVTDVFVSAVVEIARRSGKMVIAEGIESEADLMRATAAGCDAFQGYHFGKPAFLEDMSPLPLSETSEVSWPLERHAG